MCSNDEDKVGRLWQGLAFRPPKQLSSSYRRSVVHKECSHRRARRVAPELDLSSTGVLLLPLSSTYELTYSQTRTRA